MSMKCKKIRDILNIDLIITGCRIRKSKFKDNDYIAIQIIINDEEFVTFTNSKLLIQQIKRRKGNIPFIAKIIKSINYYSLS